MSAVKNREFVSEISERPAVGDDVMQDQEYCMMLLIELQETRPQQRATLEVERKTDPLPCNAQCFGTSSRLRQCAQVTYRQRHRLNRVNNLYWLTRVHGESCA